MLHIIGTANELSLLPSHLPEELLTEILQGLIVLDAEYGESRNYYESGGYSVIFETKEAISKFSPSLDIHVRQPEWATWIGTTGYISCLYIMNNDFSIMAYMPASIMPQIIRKELEE